MSRSDDNILSLPPMAPDWGLGIEIVQDASDPSSNTLQSLHDINAHTWTQKVTIDSISGKARYGMRRMLELDQYAASLFHDTAETIMKINQEGQGSAYEAYHIAFNDRLAKTAARHIYGLLEVGAMSIAKEVIRPAPPGKSFMQRLLGL